MTLAIVVPAFNEEARLPATLAKLAAYRPDAELLVVDDGSRDATVACARAAGARVLALPVNRGKGAAVRAGMLAVTQDRALICDADLSTPIEELPKLEAALDRGADIAIGSRRVVKTIEIDQPLARRVFGAGFRLLVRYGLGLDVRDTMCGFKLFTRAAAHDIFARARIDRFAFDVEALYLARDRWTIAEIPVAWSHADGSRVALRRDIYRSARDLARIRFRRDRV